jgi:hypothetical protein
MFSAVSLRLSRIPAMIKLKMTAANSSSQPQILGRMAQNTDEMASIVIGDDRDECVTYTPANDHYRQKSPDTIVGSTCGREEHACGHRNRYRRGDGKSAGAPFMKEVENGIQLPMPELAVQVR